jgi:putative acetyltransferase
MQPQRQIEIRRAVPKDAPAIAAVLYESFVEFKPLYTDGGFAATTPNADQVIARMREGPIWMALREGTVVGTAAAVIKSNSVYIRGMAVLPMGRGSGTGAKLLQQIELWAGNEGYSRLFLSTTPFLTGAIRLYEKFGFQRKNESLHSLFGTPLFTMEKTVEKSVCN